MQTMQLKFFWTEMHNVIENKYKLVQIAQEKTTNGDSLTVARFYMHYRRWCNEKMDVYSQLSFVIFYCRLSYTLMVQSNWVEC